MTRHLLPACYVFLAILLTFLLYACGGSSRNGDNGGTGGGGGNGGTQQTVSITISPTTATLAPGATQQFQAAVTGTTNTAVQWQVNGVSGGGGQTGTISAAGLYTAPSPVASPMQVTVTAVAAADTSKTASATVNITGSTNGGSVTITPTRAPLTITEPQQFTATVTGNGAVTWLVDNVTGGNSTVGTISSSGLYTPPSTAGTHTVTAQLTLTPGTSASATVWVTDYPGMFTYHADKYRSGVNYQELAISASTLNTNSFGKLFALPVDGQVYSQPLYVANLAFGSVYHNVVYVATEHDGVYAFDADNQGTPLWYTSFINPKNGITTRPQPPKGLISPEMGITSTPAIDLAGNTIYVAAVTVEQGMVKHRLHALDLLTGAEKFGGPVQIAGSYSGATFDSSRQLQRPALLFLNGVVYVAFGSMGDALPYQGWIFGYTVSNGTLQQSAVLCTAPTGNQAAIWMSGGGPAADDAGNIYVATGNGPFNLDQGGKDAGETVLKLNGSLQIVDYYTPSNWNSLNGPDWDLGSAGIMLPPFQAGALVPNLIVVGGKDALMYLINRDNLGKYNANNDPAVQKIALGSPEPTNGNWFTPAAWQSWMYFGAANDSLKQYQFSSGLLSGSPTSQSAAKFNYPGTTPMISANGTSGIVWALDNSAYFGGTPNGGVNTPGPAILHAYKADDLTTELYNSTQAGSRDITGVAIKFTAPTIANGHVYIGGAGQVTVYGVLP